MGSERLNRPTMQSANDVRHGSDRVTGHTEVIGQLPDCRPSGSARRFVDTCAFVGTNPADEPITSGLPVIRECLQSVLTSLLAATNRRNRRQFYEKTVSPPFGHRDQAGEVDLVLQIG